LRLWVDILTPKQVLFFRPVIDELRKRGHQVLATSRSYREVGQISKLVGLELKFVGTRGGKEPLDQFRASLDRIGQLLPLVNEFGPDAALSVASADCARISFALRFKHVAVNDSPHSLVAGKLSLPLSHHLLSPWLIPYSAWAPFGLGRGQITRYRALDPAAWLKREAGSLPPGIRRDKERPSILVRLEESYAPYMIGTDESWSEKVLSRLAASFGGCNLVALCRYQDQLEDVKRKFGASFVVPEMAVDGASLIRECDVFVGMGGTMTTEAALLGVPAISVYQGGDLYTERYLESKRLLLKTRSLDRLVRYVRKSMDERYRRSCAKRAKQILDWMDDPVERIARYLDAISP
jgi:uncharacterized protein